jgi:hypothetical protein
VRAFFRYVSLLFFLCVVLPKHKRFILYKLFAFSHSLIYAAPNIHNNSDTIISVCGGGGIGGVLKCGDMKRSGLRRLLLCREPTAVAAILTAGGLLCLSVLRQRVLPRCAGVTEGLCIGLAIIPRLKRLLANPREAKLMHSHEDGQNKDKMLRHPVVLYWEKLIIRHEEG